MFGKATVSQLFQLPTVYHIWATQEIPSSTLIIMFLLMTNIPQKLMEPDPSVTWLDAVQPITCNFHLQYQSTWYLNSP